MVSFAKDLTPVNIEDEMRQSYVDYAMSVIVGRALPDARDGLKPVHRRVLFAMRELGVEWNKPYKKSARVVGDVIGKYHPHGDTAVYDTLVRMAQPFSLRYMLVDGQGNFGSVDGDAPAAMRYTEVRMARIAHEMLSDIDKETVDFVPNYDGSEHEPAILPARVPNLLVNGSSGIAVGMATNIPPHNLREVIDACLALLENPDLDTEVLTRIIPGPDFPTAAIINGREGIGEAYATGRGRIHVRARTETEDDGERIVVTELPYQVNKARLMERIAELVKEKKLEGIREMRDESDKDGMRLVIELRRGEYTEVVLNNLFQQTQMQVVFGINMVALVQGRPKTVTLRELIECFLRHRREVVTRRTIHELRKARERGHILEGLAVALANIDPIIALIKASPNPAEAKQGLLNALWVPGVVTDMLDRAGATLSKPEDLPPGFGLTEGGYRLTEVQAQAILDLRLHRLTGLEQEKIVQEYHEVLERIRDLLDILVRPERLVSVIRDELNAVREQYGDERRTEIRDAHVGLSLADLITQEDVVVTLSHEGYAKAQPVDQYRSQRRGGKGKTATTMKEADFIERMYVANTHDTILCFSNRGRLYWLKVYELPQAARTARGKPMVNLLPLEEGERITAFMPIKSFEPAGYVLLATRQGTVKKCALTEFSRPRSTGIIAIDLPAGDELVGVALTDGAQDVMLLSSAGKAMRFHERQVRAMGRTARGVRGMRLGKDDVMIALIIVASEGPGEEDVVPDAEDTAADTAGEEHQGENGEPAALFPAPESEGGAGQILCATERGYGKRTPVREFPRKGRGGQGVIAIQTTARNGKLVGAILVRDEEEVVLITDRGTLVRTPAKHISLVGRNTQGVTLMGLDADERVVGIERIADVEADGEGDEPGGASGEGEEPGGANGDA
ncbi:MAG: DNA gyrase subunit A [Gammaproteobacteria bacterium]